MSSGDTARIHHHTARLEIIERLRLRDNVLVTFLGAIGALFGISFGTSVNKEILLVIPYLSLGAATIISQHQEVIGSLGQFLHNELQPFMNTINESAPQWDTSDALGRYMQQAIWLRTIGHLLLIITPALIALFLNWRHGFYSAFPEGPVWWSGILFTVLAIAVIIKSYKWRRSIQSSSK
ncbi:MAG: hypothetical protein A2Y94_11420 [Caldithrix sp. RBG_13_44_9]|nr:MAG: hypothetical protein A2Y94_11420 [Caldithrix sp. RBG_13_44_9]